MFDHRQEFKNFFHLISNCSSYFIIKKSKNGKMIFFHRDIFKTYNSSNGEKFETFVI